MTASTPRLPRESRVEAQLRMDEAEYISLLDQIRDHVHNMGAEVEGGHEQREMVDPLYVLVTRLSLAKAAVEKGLRRTR